MINNPSSYFLDRLCNGYFIKLCMVYGKTALLNRIEYIITDLAQNSILYALGILDSKSYIWKKSSVYGSVLKHSINMVFKNLLLEFFKSEVSNLDKSEFYQSDCSELSGSDLINLSGFADNIPAQIKDEIILYLDNGDSSKLKEIKPYLEQIYKRLEL